MQIQMITYNNESTLDASLSSLAGLGDIIIVDRGSSDSTCEIARKHKATVMVDSTTPRNIIRNKLIEKSDWHMVVEPWETLATEHQSINDLLKQPAAFRVMVSFDDIITKETRIFHKDTKLSFEYPIFESLKPDNKAEVVDAILCASPHETSYLNTLKQIKEWQISKPNDPQSYYYEAFCHLANSSYKEFIRSAENYLFRCTSMAMSVAMTRYYLAYVYCHLNRNAKLSLDNLIVLLSSKPLMAEAWCLLGDIHYFLVIDFDKAKHFYEMAITFGKRRKITDTWPIQLSKYSSYPQQMINSCSGIYNHKQLIQLAKTQPSTH